MNCSEQPVLLLCCLNPAFTLRVSVQSKWCSHRVVLIGALVAKILASFYQRYQISIRSKKILIVVNAFSMAILTSLSVDVILRPRYMDY